jgi:hypothetical protein
MVFGFIQGCFCRQAQVLQNSEWNQGKSEMAHKSLVDTTPTGGQTSELYGVPEERFDGPAVLLAEHECSGIGVLASGCQHLNIPVTVSGHD